jgi:HD-like signal output (HDOD) protein
MATQIITTLESQDENILYGLDAWTKHLCDKPLPARASTLKRLNKLIESDSSTVKQLSVVVKKDPVLTLYVVREAQRKHNAKDSEVKSILHAVTSLGYDGISSIVNDIKPMSLNPTNVQQKRFLHAIATSQHAAYQVQEWMSFKNLPLIDESYLAALFYSVGFWSLWLHAPIHMQQIQTRIHEKGESPIDVEHDILGCTMQMISQKLSAHWQLSKLTQLAQSHDTSPSTNILQKLHKRVHLDPSTQGAELRSLNHITQQKHFVIKLANWLALTASRDWYSQTLSNNIDLVSDYLQTPTELTIKIVHSACARSSRDYFAPGIMSPACQLLFIPSDIKIHYKMGDKELSSASKLFPEPQVPMIKPIAIDECSEQYHNIEFYHLIEKHLQADKEKTKFSKASQILSALSQGLEKGLDVKTIALFSIDEKNSLLKTIQTFGLNKQHPLNNLNINYSNASKLQELCKSQTYTVYDSSTSRKLTPAISSQLLTHASNSFMLYSIFKKNQAVALIYIDMQDQEITNFIRHRVRHLCYCASQALEKL